MIDFLIKCEVFADQYIYIFQMLDVLADWFFKAVMLILLIKVYRFITRFEDVEISVEQEEDGEASKK
jgi:hypothetical protein